MNVTALGEVKTPVEEYWTNRVLMANSGLEEGLGGVQWELVGCLGLAWLLVYLIVWKGLHQSGKVRIVLDPGTEG